MSSSEVQPGEEQEGASDTSSLLLTTAYILIMLLILAGNFLVVLSILLDRAMWTVTNIFIFSLSSADLLVGLFVIPASVTVIGQSEVTGFFQCTMMPYLQLMSVMASVGSMVVICVERYRAIVVQKSPLTRALALKIVAAVWLISALYAGRLFLQIKISQDHLQHLKANDDDDDDDDEEKEVAREIHEEASAAPLVTASGLTDEDDDDDDHAFCSLFVEEDTTDIYFRVADFFILFLLPMVSTTVMYTIIMKRLWAPNVAASSQNTARKLRVVRMCIVVIVCFFLCWLPWHLTDIVADTLEILEGGEEEEEGEEEEGEGGLGATITTMIALSNSFMSPIVYVIFNRVFREKVRKLLVCARITGRNRVEGVPQSSSRSDTEQVNYSTAN